MANKDWDIDVAVSAKVLVGLITAAEQYIEYLDVVDDEDVEKEVEQIRKYIAAAKKISSAA